MSPEEKEGIETLASFSSSTTCGSFVEIQKNVFEYEVKHAMNSGHGSVNAISFIRKSEVFNFCSTNVIKGDPTNNNSFHAKWMRLRLAAKLAQQQPLGALMGGNHVHVRFDALLFFYTAP